MTNRGKTWVVPDGAPPPYTPDPPTLAGAQPLTSLPPSDNQGIAKAVAPRYYAGASAAGEELGTAAVAAARTPAVSPSRRPQADELLPLPTVSPARGQTEGAVPKFWDQIVRDYKKAFKDREPDENGALLFHSKEEAQEFFKEQAAEGRQFCCSAFDKTTNKPVAPPNDWHVFSPGGEGGKVYSGSRIEIEAALERDGNKQHKALFAAYVPKPSPTQAFRDQVSRAVNDAQRQEAPSGGGSANNDANGPQTPRSGPRR